ncbi:hypothetical protein [Parvularcula sp. LCG005]|uniref:CAF17-like 4Fe-4S cluster assembly/insertion protein YgfZ n=1 Tax=Parvularcula sp. LCG005 TaxID=3078805 RepID=UPI002941D39F|nr:hypothetical protein [Parvularcula sp. LCG005]WOI52776.1 hypothetical protein RUI03_11525 [Parvularcula sp. LCG005]
MIHIPNTDLTRDIIKMSGEDVVTFLQGLLTCNVEKLSAGAMMHGALLTPQGKILDTMFLTRTDEAVFIDLVPGRGDAFRRKMMLYRLRAKVVIEEANDMHVAVSAEPISGDNVLTSSADPRLPTLGYRAIVSGPAEPADEPAYHRAMVTAGIPTFGDAYDEAEVFPLNVNLDLLHGIDHKKGCFVGQEVASRMFRKGSIRKRTWLVRGTDLQKGQSLKHEDRIVGTVTSVAEDTGTAMVSLDRFETEDGQLQVTTPEGGVASLIRPDYVS